MLLILKSINQFAFSNLYSRPILARVPIPGRSPHFQRVMAPDKNELEDLVQLISQGMGRCLERQGLLERDADSNWQDLDPPEDNAAMPHILENSVSYWIAVGPQQGRL